MQFSSAAGFLYVRFSSPVVFLFLPQMPVYYYPSGQYPTSATQQYRPLASVQYGAQRGQQIPQAAQQAGTWPLVSRLLP